MPEQISLSEQEAIIEQWLPAYDKANMPQQLLSSAGIVAKAQEYGLSLPEQMAIRYWSDDGYAAINAALHKTWDLTDTQLAIELTGITLLRQALDKLPNYSAEVVYSRQDFPVGMLKQLLSYEDYTFAGFLAANLEYDLFSHRKHRLIIQSKTGKHIAWISANSATENEVLFKNSTSFNVLDIQKKFDNSEIPENEIWFFLEEASNE